MATTKDVGKKAPKVSGGAGTGFPTYAGANDPNNPQSAPVATPPGYPVNTNPTGAGTGFPAPASTPTPLKPLPKGVQGPKGVMSPEEGIFQKHNPNEGWQSSLGKEPPPPPPPHKPSPLELALQLGMSGKNPAISGAYLSQLQQSLAGARSDVAHQLAGALADINQNKVYAAAALGQLAPGINSAYDQADKTTAAGQANATANLAANYGNTSGHIAANMGGGSLAAYMQPEAQAAATEKGADLANIPLLNVGIQQAAAQAAAAANNGALGDYSQLGQLGAQLTSQQGIAEMNAAASQAQQNQAYLQSIGMAGISQGNTLEQIAAQAKAASSPVTGNSPLAGGTYGTSGLTQAQVQSAWQSPDWSNNIQAVQNGTFTQRDLDRLQAQYPVLYNVLKNTPGVGDNKAFTNPKK